MVWKAKLGRCAEGSGGECSNIMVNVWIQAMYDIHTIFPCTSTEQILQWLQFWLPINTCDEVMLLMGLLILGGGGTHHFVSVGQCL